jgi:hypothetical protein
MRLRRRPAQLRRQRRRGAVLVMALVCLLIVMAMLGSLLLAVVHSGRQLHVERDRRQCELLLQAGLDRAAVRLARDREYSGETWDIPASELPNQGAGQVTIELSTDENPSARRLLVAAEYPTGSERSVRRSLTVRLSNEPSSPAQE